MPTILRMPFLSPALRRRAKTLLASALLAAFLPPGVLTTEAGAEVTVLPPVPGDSTWDEKGIMTEPARPDKRYFVEIKADGIPLPIHRTRWPRHNYVHFMTDKPVKLSLRFNSDHADSVIVPLSATMRIRPVRIDGKNFEYQFQPGDYAYLERLRLFIIANAPPKYNPKETDPEVLSAAALGIDNTGKAEAGAKINAAIRQIEKSGGAKKTLYFPPGIYTSGTIRLRSNVTLFLAPGSLIRASKNPAEWDLSVRDSLSNYWKNPSSALLFAFSDKGDTVRNATVCGLGALDGLGDYWRTDAAKPADAKTGCNEPYCWDWDKTGRAHLVYFVGTRDTEIREVTLRNPVFNNLSMVAAKRCRALDLKIIGDFKVNNDGLVMDQILDSKYHNCIVASGDDGFSFKSGYAFAFKEPNRNDTLSRCTFLTGYPGFKAGWGFDKIYDSHVEDCFFKGEFKIEPKKVSWRVYNNQPLGVSDSVVVRNLVFRNVYMNSNFIFKNLNPGDIKLFNIENLRFENAVVKGNMYVENTDGLHFTNLVRGGKVVTSLGEAGIQQGAKVANITFKVDGSVKVPYRAGSPAVRRPSAPQQQRFDARGRREPASLPAPAWWRPSFLKEGL